MHRINWREEEKAEKKTLGLDQVNRKSKPSRYDIRSKIPKGVWGIETEVVKRKMSLSPTFDLGRRS